MALTQQQLKANEEFFKMVSVIGKSYLWPDYGFLYTIENDGTFVCPSKRAYQVLKDNTPKSFHSKIKRK